MLINFTNNRFNNETKLSEYTEPYSVQAQETQESMETIQQNYALTDEQKKDRYDDMLDDYKTYMENARKVTVNRSIVRSIARSTDQSLQIDQPSIRPLVRPSFQLLCAS